MHEDALRDQEDDLILTTEPGVRSERPSLTWMVWIVLRGFAMGSADVVPGVSGGTVALLTGIYPRLITSISAGSRALGHFVRLDFSGGMKALKRVDWFFLVSLIMGAAAAVLTLARVIQDLLHDEPIRIAGLFLGLIVGTIVIAWRLLRSASVRHVLVAVGVGIAAFLLFGLQSGVVADPGLPVFFVSGMLAICAFILPGVSGSFLLLSIGTYQAVLSAVNDRQLAAVAVFAFGAIVGLALFSQLLERLLNRHYDNILAILIGLMLGSLRILWPWPNGLGNVNGVGATVLGVPEGDVALPIVLATVAAAAVIGFSMWAERREI